MQAGKQEVAKQRSEGKGKCKLLLFEGKCVFFPQVSPSLLQGTVLYKWFVINYIGGENPQLASALQPTNKGRSKRVEVAQGKQREKTRPPKNSGKAHFPHPDMCLPIIKHESNSTRADNTNTHAW